MTRMNLISGVVLTLVMSVMFIVLSILYFFISLFIIKVAANWAGYAATDGSTIVLTAGIIAAASIIGSAMKR